MAISPEAYIDTSALIAFLDRSDSYYLLFCQRFADPPRLLTTPLVLAQGHAWFLRRYERTKTIQFLVMIESMVPLKVAGIGPREQKAAQTFYGSFLIKISRLPMP